MKTLIYKSRLRTNLNLTQFTGSHYAGLPIQVNKGPFVLEYLERVHETIQRALTDYPRLLAIRFDLHYPYHQVLPDDAATSSVMQRFVDSLKAKIKHDRYRAGVNNMRVHDTVVRYVWVKEYGVEGRPHYHFLLLLNRDAYHTLGFFNSQHENLYSRIVSAWESALRLTWDEALGLVQIPKNPTYHVRNSNEFADLFFRVSYMCKVKTKRYGGWEHAFGCSRS
jgi:hypothetical protein